MRNYVWFLVFRAEDLNRDGGQQTMLLENDKKFGLDSETHCWFSCGGKNSKAAHASVEVWENRSHASACL